MTSSVIPPSQAGPGVGQQYAGKFIIQPGALPQQIPQTAITGTIWNPGPQTVWLSHDSSSLQPPLTQYPQAIPLPPSAVVTWDFSPGNGTWLALSASANASQAVYALFATQLFLSPAAVTGGPRIPWTAVGYRLPAPSTEQIYTMQFSYDDMPSVSTNLFTTPAGYTRSIQSFTGLAESGTGSTEGITEIRIRKGAVGVPATATSPIIYYVPLTGIGSQMSQVVTLGFPDGITLYAGESFVVTGTEGPIFGASETPSVCLTGYDWASA